MRFRIIKNGNRVYRVERWRTFRWETMTGDFRNAEKALEFIDSYVVDRRTARQALQWEVVEEVERG